MQLRVFAHKAKILMTYITRTSLSPKKDTSMHNTHKGKNKVIFGTKKTSQKKSFLLDRHPGGIGENIFPQGL